MRSKLFVPASRPELFAKALRSAADALSFDLEDAVPHDRKDAARDALRDLLRTSGSEPHGKVLIVRVNPFDSPYFQADLAAVVQPGLDYLNLPKPEDVETVRAVAQALEAAEQANGVTRPVRLLLNIESPLALMNAYALATAHPRVAGLQLGLGDLFEPMGVARREAAAIQQAMFTLRIASAAAGVFAYDSAFANIADVDGFRAEAQLSQSFGFLGKSCIHPSQIALANDVFRPSDEEIAHAVRVMVAAHDAAARGLGAYVVDGQMIDPPFFERARAIVTLASDRGLLSEAQRAVLSLTNSDASPSSLKPAATQTDLQNKA